MMRCPSLRKVLRLLSIALVISGFAAPPALAQQRTLPGKPPAQSPDLPPPAPDNAASLRLLATFGSDPREIPNGLQWRLFLERAEPDGSHKLVAESDQPSPIFQIPSGNYVVHVAYGLAGAAKRISLEEGARIVERLPVNAGALRVVGTLSDQTIASNRLSISVFVPDGNNPEGKLVARNMRGNEVLRLPEGTYHVNSTILDTSGLSPQANLQDAPSSNSVVEADVRVQAGKTTVATLRHRAASLTLKLVNSPGAEALANTSFTILTPGGDVLRELIGAFPSLILAEGEYLAIARNDGRTFQSVFRVESGQDRDVEILARN